MMINLASLKEYRVWEGDMKKILLGGLLAFVLGVSIAPSASARPVPVAHGDGDPDYAFANEALDRLVNMIDLSSPSTTNEQSTPSASVLDLLTTNAVQSNTNLLVLDVVNASIKSYNGNTGAYQSDFVSSQSGGLSIPSGATFKGNNGNLYVADSAVNRVIEYNGATGALINNQFVAIGSGGLSQPAGITFGGLNNNLFVTSAADPFRNLLGAVLQFDGTTGAFINNFAAVPTGFNPGAGLVFGPNGNLFSSDTSTSSILQFNGTTGAFINTFASGNGLIGASNFLFSPVDGSLLVTSGDSNTGPGQILQFDGTTGAFQKVFASGNGLTSPAGLAFGQNNKLYVSDNFNNNVLQFDGITGAFDSQFIAAGSGGLSQPGALLFAPVPEPSGGLGGFVMASLIGILGRKKKAEKS
jgi:sugar lactone lactonase YvrE